RPLGHPSSRTTHPAGDHGRASGHRGDSFGKTDKPQRRGCHRAYLDCVNRYYGVARLSLFRKDGSSHNGLTSKLAAFKAMRSQIVSWFLFILICLALITAL